MAQSKCQPDLAARTATIVHRRQADLLQVKVEEMETDVAPSLQAQIGALKNAIANAVAATMACTTTSEDAPAIQAKLAEALKANLPEKPFQPSVAKSDETSNGPVYDDQVYGAGIKVAVSAPANAIQLRAIEVSFGIECGDDTMLLIYATSADGWTEALRWQSPDYKEISGAFGDFFLVSILSGDDAPATWRAVVAHGTPWCTSRFSGFDLDVLAPTADPTHPQIVWHTQRGYSRGDYESRLRSTGDIFEFRINVPALSIDSYERTVFYRYKVESNRVTRLQPIALNARGFVDEWITMPWDEAKDQTDTAASEAMYSVYKGFQHPNNDTYFVEDSDGPVRACAESKQFQVEIDSTKEIIVPGLPGGRTESLPRTYFRVIETGDGYEMLKASSKPDPTCGGPDLMKKAGVR